MLHNIYEVSQQNFVISTDQNRLDVDTVYKYLHDKAYWCKGIPRDVVERSIKHSLCFGIYHETEQVGFARIVSDYATFAYLCDVFVLSAYRGHGLSKWMMECILAHPLLQGLRRFYLVTSDAHGLYQKYGFSQVVEPEPHMQKVVPAHILYGHS